VKGSGIKRVAMIAAAGWHHVLLMEVHVVPLGRRLNYGTIVEVTGNIIISDKR